MARILLVEDNEMNRDMLSRRLRKRGHEVLIAVDGQQGIDMVMAERPDIVLLDMSLPVVDGWEAASRLKSDPAVRDIPIIALTAHAMAGDRPASGRRRLRHETGRFQAAPGKDRCAPPGVTPKA